MLRIIALLIFLVVTGLSYSQQYTDSAFNASEKIRLGRYLKYNPKEKLWEFYDNDTARFKLKGTITQFSNWRVETVSQQRKYIHGRIHTSGDFFLLYAPHLHKTMAINRHLYYRRNGKIKCIAGFSRYGDPLYDSLFDKRGRFEKVIFYPRR